MSQTLITVIRHSLAAANAALDLLENSPQNVPVKGCDAVQRIVEAVVPAVEAAAEVHVPVVPSGTLDLLVGALSDPRYRLRTTSELADIAGIESDEVRGFLTGGNISYVVKHRRSDSAELLGLASRN